MTDDPDKSLVEISIGDNQLRMEGTEDFLSNQLSEVLDRLDLSKQFESGANGDSRTATKNQDQGEVSQDGSETPTSEDDDGGPPEDGDSELHKVARRLEVDYEKLAEHFYIDEDGIHVHNPLKIEPKFAALGYCTIKEIVFDEIYHDNKGTKDKLIDIEKVEIDQWGRNFLPDLRSEGLIKDNPNVDRDRNKPFKITPSGRREFVEWLNEDR